MTTERQLPEGALGWTDRGHPIWPEVTCAECGTVETPRWAVDVSVRLVHEQHCFICDFWLQIVAEKDQYIRIDGRSYHAAPEDARPARGPGRGFDGSRFVILMDGADDPIVSTNLWTQGDIPDRFRDRLPNNAVMVR